MIRRGIDTNVLVYAHMAGLSDHAQVHRFLVRQLQDPDVLLVFTPGILHEFLHVTTDRRRFVPPLTMSEALATVRMYQRRPNVEMVATNGAALEQAFALIERHQLGRKRLADTLFAATLLHHGVAELVTCNPADFRVFEALRLVDPRAP